MTTPKRSHEPAPSYDEVPPSADASARGALLALRRAAVRARQLALQSGTDLIVVRAGQVVRVSPQQEPKP
jgi:hypothetical protein